MCGRFMIKTDLQHIQLAFKIDQVAAEVKASNNVAPGQPVLTVAQRDSQKVLQVMRWGLIPSWAKDESVGYRMINARAEGVAEKPSFKRPLKSQRCLIVADGFYEWRKDGARKTPMFIHLKSDEPFGFAGLYDIWKPPEGDSITSCTIITTTPNSLMESIHDRMPVILPTGAYADWLNPSNQDLVSLCALLKPYPAGEMDAYEISPRVNSPKNDSPDLIERVSS